MAPMGRSKGKGRMESIEENVQGPNTPEFTGEEDTPRSPSDATNHPQIRLQSEPSVADRLDRLEEILTRFITASLSNAHIGGPIGTTGGRTTTMPEESPENSESHTQVEFTTLPEDSKKRIHHEKAELSSSVLS
jgi:hypothetical protein